MTNQVVLVDSCDIVLGTMDKMEAHQKGLLHRAFSVFIFNHKGEMLLQKRAASKYHSGGLWTNACCSHPNLDENAIEAASRRVKEEMGIEVSPEYQFSFIYHAILENGLTEHELDYVYFAQYDNPPVPNKDEVEDWAYRKMNELEQEINSDPEKFTVWFRLLFKEIQNKSESF